MTTGRTRFASASIVLALLAGGAAAKTDSQPKLEPGPAAISAQERDRTGDPGTSPDAIVFIEESKRVETSAGRAKAWYHVRLKILTEAGLALAAVEIPGIDEQSKLQRWWGHLILPGGEAFSLPADKLEDRVDPVTGERWIRGKFSKAVPGCVLDWGYEATGVLFSPFNVVALQKSVPIDHLMLRWRRIGSVEDGSAIGGYQVQNPLEGMDVVQDKQGALLRAEHLPVAKEGSHPALLVAWSLHPVRIQQSGTVDISKAQDGFWSDRAKTIEDEAEGFAGSREKLEAAMRVIPGAAGADLGERLRAAYAWLEAKFAAHPNKWSSMPGVAVLRTHGRADKALSTGAGVEIDRTLTFLSIARAWGADASLVLATDPAVWKWDRSMLLVEQFSHVLVEVRAGSGRPDLVALGRHLPYGEVPHELSGAPALRVTNHGAEAVQLP